MGPVSLDGHSGMVTCFDPRLHHWAIMCLRHYVTIRATNDVSELLRRSLDAVAFVHAFVSFLGYVNASLQRWVLSLCTQCSVVALLERETFAGLQKCWQVAGRDGCLSSDHHCQSVETVLKDGAAGPASSDLAGCLQLAARVSRLRLRPELLVLQEEHHI